MIQIVIPMAGLGSRFSKAGFKIPKPFIRVGGRPMIEWVVRNLFAEDCRFIFVGLNEHLKMYDLRALVRGITKEFLIVGIDAVSNGAACTVLEARNVINFEQPLVIANSDQFLDFDVSILFSQLVPYEDKGVILTMKDNDPKWSYVRRDKAGRVVEVVEKQVISNEATVGVYGFSRAELFFEAADEMVESKHTVNGEYYVAPVYNYIVEKGVTVSTIGAGHLGENIFGLGIPADLEEFLASDVFRMYENRYANNRS